MVVLRPKIDVWPYVKSLSGVLCYKSLFSDEDNEIQVGDHPLTIDESFTSDHDFIWFVDYSPADGTHIMVRSIQGYPVLHFLVLEVRTQWGVVLKRKYDIASYFGVMQNPNLVNERIRMRSRH